VQDLHGADAVGPHLPIRSGRGPEFASGKEWCVRLGTRGTIWREFDRGVVVLPWERYFGDGCITVNMAEVGEMESKRQARDRERRTEMAGHGGQPGCQRFLVVLIMAVEQE
jgi:hypothetical protein